MARKKAPAKKKTAVKKTPAKAKIAAVKTKMTKTGIFIVAVTTTQ